MDRRRNPHAKGNRRHHHLDPAFLEFLLNLLAASGIDPGVICSGGKVGGKFACQAFGLLARGCVDDCRPALRRPQQFAGELGPLRRRGLDNLNCEVIAAKAVNETVCLRQPQDSVRFLSKRLWSPTERIASRRKLLPQTRICLALSTG